jgi:hypothetical protein
MRIEILSEAADDLVAGAKFYERKRAGLGELLFELALFGYRFVASVRRNPPVRFRFSPSSVQAIPFRDFFIVLIGIRNFFAFTAYWICAETRFGSGNDFGR